MRQRFMRPGIETVPNPSGIARLRYSKPKFDEKDIVDLTLPIGSYGEQITTRRLEVSVCRRSQYSGRLEYKLNDGAQNRIDYTRWFEESSLSKNDPSVVDPVCKRTSNRGKPCTATPTFPAGLCIKHKAKLDWDRARQRQKLETELNEKSATNGARRGSAATQFTASSDGLSSPLSRATTLTVHVDQIAMSMWGDVELFTTTALHAARPGLIPDFDTEETTIYGWRTCILLIITSAVTLLMSLSLALWWSITRDDVSGGFTMGGYIVAAGALTLYPLQFRHSKNCRCWHRVRQTRVH